jgi:hypothetical protein
MERTDVSALHRSSPGAISSLEAFVVQEGEAIVIHRVGGGDLRPA